jgi:hypothetical protein
MDEGRTVRWARFPALLSLLVWAGAANPVTGTVYVANLGNSVSVIR